MRLTTSNGIQVKVEKEPFAKGGEGAIHRIISPLDYAGFCAKLYFPKERNSQRKEKVEYMTLNPPPNLKGDNHIICWPKDVLFQGRKFVGFMMPVAFSGSIQLYELCTPRLKDKHGAVWQRKFDRSTGVGIQSRLKLCTNLAAAIHNIHTLQSYVLVDLKPQNILVTDSGKVSIIDCDSIQISHNRQILFPAKVATPEYVPPEGVNINPEKNRVLPSWDRFSMAVVFYEVLFGLHPYAASFSGRYQNSETLDSKIKSGLFVHGKNSNYVSAMPPLHQSYEIIPESLRTLFRKAFDIGNQIPEARPTAEEWGKTIFSELRRETRIIAPIVNLPAKPRRSIQPISHPPALPTKKSSDAGRWIIFALVAVILIILSIYSFINIVPKQRSSDPIPELSIPDKKELIRAFIRAEDFKVIDRILPFYAYRVDRYYDTNNLSRSEMRDQYLNAWNKLQLSYNTIQEIVKLGRDEFLLTTKFTSKLKRRSQAKTIQSSVYIRFEGDKIVETYSKSMKTLPSELLRVNKSYRMLSNVNLRYTPEQEDGNIKYKGIYIYNKVDGLGYSVKDIKIYGYQRTMVQDKVVQGCREGVQPYWYFVKLTFPDGEEMTGWVWGSCLVAV